MTPGEADWLSVEDAAEQLHLRASYVLHLVQRGGLGRRRDGVWVADAEAVRARQRDREEWISFAGAARLLGCSTATIGYHARVGHLEQRPVTSTGHPSLRLTSVLTFGEHRARDREARANRSEPLRASAPPDDHHVWLDTATVAIMLAISDSRVRQLARRGSLPFITRGKRRRWFRRDHVEVIAAARAARESHALPG